MPGNGNLKCLLISLLASPRFGHADLLEKSCRITAGENIMRGMSTPKKVPVNGKLASPLRSPKSAGGTIRCVCENNIDRGFMVQCEVNFHILENQPHVRE